MQDADMERPAWIAEAIVKGCRTIMKTLLSSRSKIKSAVNAVQAQAELIGLDKHVASRSL